jgi:hypothetical protein
MSNTTVLETDQAIAGDLITILGPFVTHLQTLAANDPTLRAHLRALAQKLLEFTAEPPAPVVDVEPPATEPAIPAPLAELPEPEVKEPAVNGFYGTHTPSVRESLRILRPVPTTPVWRSPAVTDSDLPLIVERCRLKAEGSRWSATRQRLLREGTDYDTEIEPQDRDIIARAKMLPECFLWMCHRSGPTPDDLTQYEDLAGCFDAAAAAVALLDLLIQNGDEDQQDIFEQALDLAAEAQSALRVAIAEIGGSTDSDQYKIFQWLKTTGSERQILIRRYMRKDDPADPAAWRNVQEGVQQLEETLQSSRSRAKRQRSLTSKIRYHLKLIESNRGQDRTHDWQKVIEGIEELVNDGIPPSNRELRELLLPMAEEIPESLELPRNCKLVLRDLEQFLTSRSTKPEVDDTATTPTETEDVRRAAEYLRGRAVVLIGGLKRPLAADALTQALELKELIWVEGRDQTYELFEPHVARPDVAVVILAIRWSRHGFGEVKAFCDKYDKPLVRLPGGYNPNQIAFHIMSQVGERLEHKNGVVAG